MRARCVWLTFAISACSASAGSGASSGQATPPGAGLPPPVAPGPGPAPVPSSGRPAFKVTLADVGLEGTSLDRTTDPCVDFYQFACGGWLQNNPIPPDRARWGRGDELDERTAVALASLLEQDARGGDADARARQLGDYYASCMDEAAIERAGLAPIQAQLARVTQVHDGKTWLAAVVSLHELGAWVVWEVTARPDLDDPTTNVTYVDVAGLGLPDRGYYLRPELAAYLDAYTAHVGQMLVLAGTPPARAAGSAADVVAIETELAKLTQTATEKRDLRARYHPSDLRGLQRQASSVDWNGYFKAMGFAPSKKLIVERPQGLAALDALRAKFSWSQWASYFTFHLVEDRALELPRAFADQVFALDRALTGVAAPRDRARRCVEATSGALGDLLGQQYVARYVPASSQPVATGLVDAIVRAMGDELRELDWMPPRAQALAQTRLASLTRRVGFPEQWRDDPLVVKRDDFGGNQLRAALRETHRALSRSGRPVEASAWPANAYAASAAYDPATNSLTIPAGILQAPLFSHDRSVAANLGGIGVVIGHALTDGFDPTTGWLAEDATGFTTKGACVAAQYAGFEATPGSFVDGPRTLAEDVADLGGVKLAFAAYRALREEAAKVYVADGYSEDQQFFIAVGQAWCTRGRPEDTRRRLAVDPVAPPKFRVDGALRNLPAFAAAFRCAPGTPMRPAGSCAVW